MRIGILIICTGKYITFFDQLYDSLNKNFLNNHKKKIYLFTDSNREFENDVSTTKIERKGFPGDTLYRYHYFLSIKEQLLAETDILVYMDVDSKVIYEITDDILPTSETPLFAVLHPGFYKVRNRQNGTPETNKLSTAYINPIIKRTGYVCGGIQGGCTEQYLLACEAIKQNIDQDDRNKIKAIWDDESHWNCYYVNNNHKYKLLSPSYMFPEGWTHHLNLRELTPKILALDKNHNEIRKL